MSVILETLPAQPTPVGGLFDLNLVVHSDGTPITSVQYSLQVTDAAMLGRDFGPEFPHYIELDPWPPVGATENVHASVISLDAPLGAGDHLVAVYHFRATGASEIQPGPVYGSVIGYTTESPEFQAFPFDYYQGSVLPEPGMILAFLGLLLFKRKRR